MFGSNMLLVLGGMFGILGYHTVLTANIGTDCFNGQESNHALKFNELIITPYPVRAPGPVQLKINFELAAAIPGATLHTKLWKSMWFGWLPAPGCVAHLGSCDYGDTCHLLDRMESGNLGGVLQELAQELKSLIGTGSCPAQPISKSATMNFDMPTLPTLISAVASGDFDMQIRVLDGNNVERGCLDLKFGLA